MSHKKPSWNITILVIFMLLTAAVIWLLVMWYVRNMLTFSNNFFAYNKAYYLAEWWLELQLSKIQQRGVWYQDDGDDLSSYYPCLAGNKGREWWATLCAVNASITAQWNLLSRQFDAEDCDEKSYYEIAWGDAIGFPLFVEDAVSNVFQEDVEYQDLFEQSFSVDIEVPNGNSSQELGFGIVKLVKNTEWQWDIPEDSSFSRVAYWPYASQTITRNSFPTYADDVWPWLYHFVVFNPTSSSSTSDVQFCVSSTNDLALTQIGAKSFATFRWVSVWLEARRTIELPWFVFSTVVDW